MVLGKITGMVIDLGIELAIRDEQVKKAAKASAAAALASVSAATGDVASAASLAIKSATNSASIATKDIGALSAIDTLGQVAQSATGGYLENGLKGSVMPLATSAAGASAGAIVHGENGALMGASLGASVGQFGATDSVSGNISRLGVKIGTGTAGGALGATLATDRTTKAQAFQFGFGLGSSVGGATTDWAAGGRLGESDVNSKVAQQTVQNAKDTLLNEAVGQMVGAGIYAARSDDRDYLDAAQLGRGFSGGASVLNDGTNGPPRRLVVGAVNLAKAGANLALAETLGRRSHLLRQKAAFMNVDRQRKDALDEAAKLDEMKFKAVKALRVAQESAEALKRNLDKAMNLPINQALITMRTPKFLKDGNEQGIFFSVPEANPKGPPPSVKDEHVLEPVKAAMLEANRFLDEKKNDPQVQIAFLAQLTDRLHGLPLSTEPTAHTPAGLGQIFAAVMTESSERLSRPDITKEVLMMALDTAKNRAILNARPLTIGG